MNMGMEAEGLKLRSGQRLDLAAPALLWRVRQGLVGLSAEHDEHGQGAIEALARPGDLLGVHNLLGMPRTVVVRGVTDAVIEEVPPQQHTENALLRLAYEQACRQHRDLMRLQKGAVAERVRELLVLLEEHDDHPTSAGTMTLPALGVLSWVIDSTDESVCRVIARLRDLRVLETAAPGRRQRIVQDLRQLKSPRGMTRSSRARMAAFPAAGVPGLQARPAAPDEAV